MNTEAIREAVRNAKVSVVQNEQVGTVRTTTYKFDDGLESLYWHTHDPAVSKDIRDARRNETDAIQESLDRLRAAGVKADDLGTGGLWKYNFVRYCERTNRRTEINMRTDGTHFDAGIDDDQFIADCACLVRHSGDRPDVLVRLVNGGTDATE